MTEERLDRKLRKAQVASHAAKGMPKNMRRYRLARARIGNGKPGVTLAVARSLFPRLSIQHGFETASGQ